MARLPSRQEILDFIAENPAKGSKRDIARAFGIKGAERIELKAMLRDLQDGGHLEKRRRAYRDPTKLPPVSVLLVTGPDESGDLFARPLEWEGEGPEPRVLMMLRASDPALGGGDRILARVTPVSDLDHGYEARLIRRIGHQPRGILGIFRTSAEGGRVVPVDKRADRDWLVPAGATHGARDGELVEAEQVGPRARLGLPKARIVNRLGDPGAPKAVSLIAIHQHGIPDSFPADVLEEAERATEPGPKGREDLRHIPFVTIDPEDARDHDDAVWAGPDPDAEGCHIVWVAIADVAQAVRPNSALDREARLRGNSTYFPDRVVPMLPDRLSGDLCSLHEGVDRAVLAVQIRIDAGGHRTAHGFHRGLIRSRASLTYEQAQAVEDGAPHEVPDETAAEIRALFAAYRAAAKARDARGPLELDLPERRIILSDEGKVVSVAFKERLEAHRLIEEFMVSANVCAAETLIAKHRPLLFRVHEEPTPEKVEALREVATSAGLVLAKGQVLTPRHLNRLLDQARALDESELVSMTVLRSMPQAYYHPENFGHFGLALRAYAHFTSPIRRYADLVVHRALISAHRWGDDGLSDWDVENLEETAVQISQTERRSMLAERDTTDRYLAAYLSERIGNELPGKVSGVTRFGLFVKLDETGADGLVPVRSIGAEYFRFDPERSTLMGSDSGMLLHLGQKVIVRIAEAVPVSGGLLLELLEVDGKEMPRGPTRARTGRRPSRPVKARKKAEKAAKKEKRKVTRRRR